MRLNSLSFRLFASAATWTLIVLPITAVILISMFRGAVERSFDARLNTYLTDLLAESVDSASAKLIPPPDLGVSEFNLPLAGWYWQISEVAGAARVPRPLYASTSLLAETLDLPSDWPAVANGGGLRRAYIAGPKKESLRVVERDVMLGDKTYSFAVAGDGAEIENEISDFQFMVIVALSVLGLGLVLATFFQVRFGLAPLRAVREGLLAIRSGDAQDLEGVYPVEIAPLQDELNALIHSNNDIVERARTHVGNLAHALKTPLSVITNEARGSRSEFAATVAVQAALMRTQILHHLDRARVVARANVIGGMTDVEPVVNGLGRAVVKIHENDRFGIEFSCPEGLKFQGEKQDFEEMVGNLLDNACKWARSRVTLKVAGPEGQANGMAGVIVIDVDDDGPGLSKTQRVAAVKRGRRLDETKPGSGLGLSIVAELAHLYKGNFDLDVSPLGGLRARLRLPAA